jgi:hypothetical protein
VGVPSIATLIAGVVKHVNAPISLCSKWLGSRIREVAYRSACFPVSGVLDLLQGGQLPEHGRKATQLSVRKFICRPKELPISNFPAQEPAQQSRTATFNRVCHERRAPVKLDSIKEHMVSRKPCLPRHIPRNFRNFGASTRLRSRLSQVPPVLQRPVPATEA